MPENETSSERISPSEIESSLTAFSHKLSDSAQLKPGSILIRFTDSGEEYSIEITGREARMIRAAPATAPLVEISGPSTVLKAIMDGSEEARHAFFAGSVLVQGDVPYFESLLEDIGLLQPGLVPPPSTRTRGLIQRIVTVYVPGWIFEVNIGPSPTNTTSLFLRLDGVDNQLLRASITELLSGALFARREVIVTHFVNTGEIRAVEVVPG
jgi:hypothetical protein